MFQQKERTRRKEMDNTLNIPLYEIIYGFLSREVFASSTICRRKEDKTRKEREEWYIFFKKNKKTCEQLMENLYKIANLIPVS